MNATADPNPKGALMASANVCTDSCDGAGANQPRACLPAVKATAPDRRAIDKRGCRGPVFGPRRDVLLDRSRLAPPPGLDQARLGEELQPMLPGLEGS